MKLISEENIHSKLVEYAGAPTGTSIKWMGFVDGVDFAEEKLQNLAIEFCEYGMKILMDVDRVRVIPPQTSDLFQQFLEERNAK